LGKGIVLERKGGGNRLSRSVSFDPARGMETSISSSFTPKEKRRKKGRVESWKENAGKKNHRPFVCPAGAEEKPKKVASSRH